MKIMRWVARHLFCFADWISHDLVLDLACDMAMDHGFGYCDDCSPDDRCDESRD
jgi:hypothetical protein